MTADPTIVAAQLPQPDPRGWLTFRSLPDDAQVAEDTTAVADRDRAHCDGTEFARVATVTEQNLLTLLSFDTTLPMTDPWTGEATTQLYTFVSYEIAGVRGRRWPQIEANYPNYAGGAAA